jgi:hypothetical protein
MYISARLISRFQRRSDAGLMLSVAVQAPIRTTTTDRLTGLALFASRLTSERQLHSVQQSRPLSLESEADCRQNQRRDTDACSTVEQIPPVSSYRFARTSVAERVICAAPIWMSTDLRDGNQALTEPMNSATKLRFF